MAAPLLRCPSAPSDTGAYRIAWEMPAALPAGAAARFRLVERGGTPGGEERVLYEGPQRASTITGRTAGEHRYRVASLSEGTAPAWSAWCAVEVRPPSLTLALALFSVGLVVCLATVVAVVRGHATHRRGDLG